MLVLTTSKMVSVGKADWEVVDDVGDFFLGLASFCFDLDVGAFLLFKMISSFFIITSNSSSGSWFCSTIIIIFSK